MPGFVLAAVVAAILFGLTGLYPPQSEDWIHLQIIAARPWQDAFDLHVSHARPLWYLGLWSMLPSGLEHPALMRIPLFAMHGLIGGCVGVLARQLGASPRRALLAVALFLCFPAVKGLAWILAISTPEHVLLMLIALIATVAHARRPRALTGIALQVALVLAILSHSAACVLPACVALLAVAVSPKRWRVLFDPWLTLHGVLGVGLVVLLASLPTAERYHSLRGLEAIAANASRALVSLVPEVVHGPAVEGLRGVYGTAGFAFGIGLCALTAALGLWLIWRATPVGRALLLAAAIDLVPPILTAGFVVRYAYFPAALLAVALVLAAKPTKGWIAVLGLLAAGWFVDSVVDVAEVRRGGELVDAVVAAARTVRGESGPGVRIALVDAPGTIGAERDVPVFNWGLAHALAWHGIGGPWLLLRTKAFVTNSDVEYVEEPRLAELRGEGVAIWWWDDASAQFVHR